MKCNINMDMNIKTVSFGICQPIPNHKIRVQNFIIYVAKYFMCGVNMKNSNFDALL